MSKASKRLSPLGAVGIALGLVGAFAGHSASAQDVSITGLAEFEIAHRSAFGIIRIEQHCAIDPDLLGP